MFVVTFFGGSLIYEGFYNKANQVAKISDDWNEKLKKRSTGPHVLTVSMLLPRLNNIICKSWFVVTSNLKVPMYKTERRRHFIRIYLCRKTTQSLALIVEKE